MIESYYLEYLDGESLCSKCEAHPSQKLHTCLCEDEIYKNDNITCDCCDKCTALCELNKLEQSE